MKHGPVPITVRIPGPFRHVCEGNGRAALTASTVAECMHNLVTLYPDLGELLFNANGEVHHYLSLFRNETDIRSLEGLETILQPNDEVSIVPAVSGGCYWGEEQEWPIRTQ